MRGIARILLSALLFLFVLAGLQPATAGSYRKSIAALGDSITRATNACCSVGEYPAQSWSTGDGLQDGIKSHYERLLRLQPGIEGQNFNYSRSGAKASDLPGQAEAAISQKAGYVTILMGANDLCTPTVETMTPVETFRTHVDQALASLDRMRPRPKVFVSSIPDIHQLWRVLHTHPAAQKVWSDARICQSMLAVSNTAEEREQVVEREIAFNAVLEETCAQYKSCRSDRGAVYEYRFRASDVSALDYFHPSPKGQAKLAQITWHAAW